MKPLAALGGGSAVVALAGGVSVAWLTWFHGGVITSHRWWVVSLFLLLSILYIAPRLSDWRLLAAGAAPVVYSLIQLLNPSHRFEPLQGLNEVTHQSWLPSSVNATACLHAVAWLVTCLLVAVLFRRYVALDRVEGVLFLSSVSLISVAAALMVINQRIQPAEHVFLYPMTGRFAYENHFAVFANLGLGSLLGLGLASQRRAHRTGAKSNPGFLCFCGSGVVFAAIVMSRSRAGILISLILFTATIISVLRCRRTEAHRWVAAVISVALVGVVFYLVRHALAKELASTIALDGFGEHRVLLYQSILELWLSRPVLGIGLGGFASAFPYVQPDELNGFFLHGHSDLLQLLAEVGVMGVVCFLIAFRSIAPSWSRIRSAWRHNDSLFIVLATAVAGLVLHSFVDFAFHLPVISLLASMLLGMLAGAKEEAV